MPPAFDLVILRTRDALRGVASAFRTKQRVHRTVQNKRRTRSDLRRSVRGGCAKIAAYWRDVPSG